MANPASAAAAVNFVGSTTPGSVITVESAFTAPNNSAGNYLVDTEVFGPNNARVAQWYENVSLTGTANVRKYEWNTQGLATGKYRVSQGIFGVNWAGTRSWVNDAGSVTLASPTNTSTKWAAAGSVSVGLNASIEARFSAPGTFSGNVLVNTEVADSSGAKVGQWYETTSIQAGETISRNYSWNLAGKPAGTYTLRQGIFKPDWSQQYVWAGQSARFVIGNSGSSVPSTTVPPTTAAPTTTVPPTTVPPTTVPPTTAAPITTTTVPPTTAAPTTTTPPTTKAPVTTVPPTTAPSAPAKWVATSASTTGVTTAIAARFTAPGGHNGNVLINTEVADANGNKVGQWYETVNMTAGVSVDRTYAWSTAGKAEGTYSVRQGVFKPDWSQTYVWAANTSKFVVKTEAPVSIVKPELPSIILPDSGSVITPSPSLSLYVDPNNFAARQAEQWKNSRPSDAALMSRVGQSSTATWFGGWNWNIKGDVNGVVSAANNSGQVPVLVAYNIPGRDCGHYSAGGANGSDAYKAWIRNFADGIGSRKAWVVLEPDALPQLDCLSSADQASRLALLNDAVNVLSANPNTYVYLDAGHANWLGTSVAAQRLKAAGVDRARGFSLNVSNFLTTSQNITYGDKISQALGGKKYVVDTSRNGNGGNGEWCNPRGRALGEAPTTATGSANADGYLWIKRPGESDGWCNGGPSAGEFWADYALELARNAWAK